MHVRLNIKYLLFFIILLLAGTLHAGTKITTTGNININGQAEAERQLQMVSDRTGGPMANGSLLSNMTGYPLGVAILGDFPSFFAGFTTSSAFTNMRYFDPDRQKKQGAFPFATLNPAIYFGLGLGKGMDVMGKLFIYSDGLYRPPIDFSYATLKKLNLCSAGGRFRYNYIPRKVILPGLLEFGGLTFAGGLDFQYSKTSISGTLSYTMHNIETGQPAPADILDNATYKPDYSASITWYTLTGSGTALAYMEFFWVLNFFTGFGVAVNWGSLSLDANGTGNVTTTDPDYLAAPAPAGSPDVGTLAFETSNTYHPYYAIPIYVAGLEINLYFIRVAFQTQVNMWNRQDVTMELGCRFQY